MSSESGAQDDHGVPSSQEEALQELAEVCRADSDVLCLASEELDEIIALAYAYKFTYLLLKESVANDIINVS